MQGLLGITRIYWKRAAILLATGLLFQFAAFQSSAQAKPKRPRITGIDHVRLYVSNLRTATDFYVNYFRLRGTMVGGVTTPGPLLVNAWQRVESQAAPSPPPKNWLAEIGFATDNIKQMHRYLATHNVAVTPVSGGPNHSLHFQLRDPEGNALSFVQRREVYEDWPTDDRQVGNRIIHAGFVVMDAAAENKFYVDLLGFKLYWQGGFKDDGLDWYELQVPDGDNWIEYMLNIPATADHKALGAQNHFSFGVRNIEAAAEQLRKNGAEKIAGPGIGRDGKRGLNVYDPDDTRVEVTEFTPAREPCCHPYTAAHPTP